jgi:hypothetical protein
MEPICCAETSVPNYQPTLRYISEELKSIYTSAEA